VAEKSEGAATGLVKWLSNGKVEELEGSQSEILDELIPELVKLDKKGLDGIGKALLKVGDSFGNGLKLFNTYFQIPDSYRNFGTEAVEKISNVFLESVGKDGIKALEAWIKAMEDGGVALRTREGGTPYPRFWKDLWDALGLKKGDTFTIVVDYDGEECRIPAEAKDMSGDHVLSPFRRGSFALLQGGEYVEAYPGLRDPSLFMKVESEEGATYVFAKDNWFERRYVEEHGGEGLQIIMYKRVGSSFDEHYIMRDVHFEGVEMPAIYFKPYDGPGIYKIEFVKKVEVKDLCDYVKNLGEDYQLAFDEASGKFRFMLFNIPLESIASRYEEGIEVKGKKVGGYEVMFPFEIEGRTWGLALLFSVDPENGELTSKFNFAYDMEKLQLGENPTWRHVTEIQASDTGDGKVLQITFELTDYDQTARVKWASGELTYYKVLPGELLESIMKEFLSKDYFSEPQFEGDATKGSMTMRVVKNIREYLTWYNDAAHGFGDHAKGIAGCELSNEVLLKKYESYFGIEGEIIIDRSGQNIVKIDERSGRILSEYYADAFTMIKNEKNKKIIIPWISEWKSAFAGEDLSVRLSEAKRDLKDRYNYLNSDLRSKLNEYAGINLELPKYGYAFAIGITDNQVKIVWETIELSGG
jgi:hypothetical protein